MKEKGITLIALVITIIILLILASVTIATLTGENGIITKAMEAREKTEIAEIIERAQIDILGKQAGSNGKITEEQLNEILAQYGTVSEDGENKILTTDKGYMIKVSDIWKGTTSSGETERNLAKDVLIMNPAAEEVASKSPYVRYNELDCRVLYNDETHGLQIITDGNLGENITLGYGDTMVTASDFTYNGSVTVNENFKIAAASYNNVVNNLNNKAKTYMDKNGNTTDARCLGSSPILINNSEFQKDTTSEMWSGTEDYLKTYNWNDKFKNSDTNYLEDVNQLNVLGLNVSSGHTWLASRIIGPAASYTGFHVSYVDSSGKTNNNGLCYVSPDGNFASDAPSHGFRPVFLLSSNVVIKGGDGSSENPYVIE